MLKEAQRYDEADRAYAMRRTKFPTGEARVKIEQEYAAADRALRDANARYSQRVERARKLEP